jgi:hypothetical protein
MIERSNIRQRAGICDLRPERIPVVVAIGQQYAVGPEQPQHVLTGLSVVRLPLGQSKEDREAVRVDDRVDLGCRPAAGTSHATTAAAFFAIGGMLVNAHDGAVDHPHLAVASLRHRLQKLVPDTGLGAIARSGCSRWWKGHSALGCQPMARPIVDARRCRSAPITLREDGEQVRIPPHPADPDWSYSAGRGHSPVGSRWFRGCDSRETGACDKFGVVHVADFFYVSAWIASSSPTPIYPAITGRAGLSASREPAHLAGSSSALRTTEY